MRDNTESCREEDDDETRAHAVEIYEYVQRVLSAGAHERKTERAHRSAMPCNRRMKIFVKESTHVR